MGNLPANIKNNTPSLFRTWKARAEKAIGLQTARDEMHHLSYARSEVGNNIISTNIAGGSSEVCGNISLRLHGIKTLENQLLPAATRALIDTIREVSESDQQRDITIADTEPLQNIRFTFNVGSRQPYGTGLDIYAHVPNSDASHQMVHISIISNALRTSSNMRKIGELFDLRFRQTLAQDLDDQQAPLEPVLKQLSSPAPQ